MGQTERMELTVQTAPMEQQGRVWCIEAHSYLEVLIIIPVLEEMLSLIVEVIIYLMVQQVHPVPSLTLSEISFRLVPYSHPWQQTNGSGNILAITSSGGTVRIQADTAITVNRGIKFPSSQQSSPDHVNTLDDYEEGSYTGSTNLLYGSTGGTITLNTSLDTLQYTKIGRLVTVSGRLQVSTVSSPTGELYLRLPFTGASLTDGQDGFCGSITYYGVNALTTAGTLAFRADSGSTVVTIVEQNTTNFGSAVSRVANSSQFWFSFQYITAT
jgi:hypothetical protein